MAQQALFHRKTTKQVVAQRYRASTRACLRTNTMIAKADPSTGGHRGLCHNWGNGAAREALRKGERLEHEIGVAGDRLFNIADHDPNHRLGGFEPGWCKFCQANAAAR